MPGIFRLAVRSFVELFVSHVVTLLTEWGPVVVQGAKSDIDAALEQLARNVRSDLDGVDPIVVGDLLKTFLRELDEPLLTMEMFPRWIAASKIKARTLQVSCA